MTSAGKSGTDFAMPLAEAMSTQRAIRRLRSDPVDDDVVLRCIELATRAPTGSNRQGWEFVIVRDPEVKHQLARLNRQAWSVYRRLGAKRARREESIGQDRRRGAVAGRPLRGGPGRRGAVPARPGTRLRPTGARGLVLRLHLPRRPEPAPGGPGRRPGRPRSPRCPSGRSRWPAAPSGYRASITPVAVVPMGWPQGGYGPTTRRPVGEVVHLDRYGNQPFSQNTTRHGSG